MHDTECPYWDQVSLNNTNPQTLHWSYITYWKALLFFQTEIRHWNRNVHIKRNVESATFPMKLLLDEKCCFTFRLKHQMLIYQQQSHIACSDLYLHFRHKRSFLLKVWAVSVCILVQIIDTDIRAARHMLRYCSSSKSYCNNMYPSIVSNYAIFRRITYILHKIWFILFWNIESRDTFHDHWSLLDYLMAR